MSCATLSRSDYEAALWLAGGGKDGPAPTPGVKFQRTSALKPLLLAAKQQRTPILNKDIAAQLSLFDLFRSMDPEFREELSGIVEYLSVPQGEIQPLN